MAPGNVVGWMYAHARIKYSYAYATFLCDTVWFLTPRGVDPAGWRGDGKMIEYFAKFIARQ